MGKVRTVTLKAIFVRNDYASGAVVRIQPGDDPAKLGDTVIVKNYTSKDAPKMRALVTGEVEADGLYPIKIL